LAAPCQYLVKLINENQHELDSQPTLKTKLWRADTQTRYSAVHFVVVAVVDENDEDFNLQCAI